MYRITRQHMRSQVAGPDPKIQTDGVGGPLRQYRLMKSRSGSSKSLNSAASTIRRCPAPLEVRDVCLPARIDLALRLEITDPASLLADTDFSLERTL